MEMRIGKTYFVMAVAWSIYPSRHGRVPLADTSWSSHIKVMAIEEEPGENQKSRSRCDTKVMIVEGVPGEDQGDHCRKDTVVGAGETPVEGDDRLEETNGAVDGGNSKEGEAV